MRLPEARRVPGTNDITERWGDLHVGKLDHTEEVAVGIFQDYEVIARFIPPRIASSPKLDQAFDFYLSALCIQIEMQSAPFA
jgi:hypothetical protein